MFGLVYVKDLKKDIFDKPFLEYLPEYCEDCGSPLEILESFTKLRCPNESCISRLTYRLFTLLEELGIDVLDMDDCKQFIKHFGATSPYSILLYNPENDGELYEGFGKEKSLSLYKDLNKKRGMLLWEFVRIGCFSEFSSSAEKLFRNYTSLTSFYKEVKDGGIAFIQNLLLDNSEIHVSEDTICVDAVMIYDSLIRHQEELEYGIQGVKILSTNITMGVYFAKDVEGFKSNKDFLYALNKKLKNNIYLYPVYTLNSNVKLLFWDDDLTTNTLVEQVRENRQDIKIVNSENIFKKILEVLQ